MATAKTNCNRTGWYSQYTSASRGAHAHNGRRAWLTPRAVQHEPADTAGFEESRLFPRPNSTRLAIGPYPA
jgi:hypothetical protein